MSRSQSRRSEKIVSVRVQRRLGAGQEEERREEESGGEMLENEDK
jgi:hypothetical protein